MSSCINIKQVARQRISSGLKSTSYNDKRVTHQEDKTSINTHKSNRSPTISGNH